MTCSSCLSVCLSFFVVVVVVVVLLKKLRDSRISSVLWYFEMNQVKEDENKKMKEEIFIQSVRFLSNNWNK
jgi:hypothetical protein